MGPVSRASYASPVLNTTNLRQAQVLKDRGAQHRFFVIINEGSPASWTSCVAEGSFEL
jgi:hypothetical protein